MSRYGVLLGNTPQPAAPSLSNPHSESQSEVVIHASVPQAIPEENTETPQNDSMTARQHDGNMASHPDGLPSSHQDSLPPRQQDGMTAYSLHAFLTEKATEKTTVRLPEQLVRYLEDTLYRIKRERKVKLSMKSILIIALAMFCQEFEQQGIDSPLYKKLLQELE